jgi:hypothetical protein
MLRYRFHFAIQNSYEVLKDPQNFNTLPAFRFHVNIHPCAHATRGACYNRGRLEAKMLELVLEGEKHVKEAKNNLVRYLYNKKYVIHFTFDKENP